MPASIKMHKYHSEHNSGVIAYGVGDDFIIIEFRDGRKYVYDFEKPGADHVNAMKDLAREGKDLTTYINQHVRENYKRKLN
jgi:hypothetical protein